MQGRREIDKTLLRQLEDSLAQEVNRVRNHRYVRPTSTGDIQLGNNHHNTFSHHSALLSQLDADDRPPLHLVDNLGDESLSRVARPHAPIYRPVRQANVNNVEVSRGLQQQQSGPVKATGDNNRFSQRMGRARSNITNKNVAATSIRENALEQAGCAPSGSMQAIQQQKPLVLAQISRSSKSDYQWDPLENSDIQFLNIDHDSGSQRGLQSSQHMGVHDISNDLMGFESADNHELLLKRPINSSRGGFAGGSSRAGSRAGSAAGSRYHPGSEGSMRSSSDGIPVLPSGRKLTINILSTWGDRHYLGLMGLEFFDKKGRAVTFSNPTRQIYADPADINVLEEYSNDPRTVDKLLDGINFTCDDLHSWLAPFTEGSSHLITVTFDTDVTLSMLRIWNYNKSRIHSTRGARYVEIRLDGRFIFRGELKQSTGTGKMINTNTYICCAL